MSAPKTTVSSGDGKRKEINPFADLELRSLRDYYLIIRERWILAISCAILAACLVGYYLISRPAVYEASASLLVERQGERVVDMQQVVDTGLESSGQLWSVMLQNHIQQMTSRNFRRYVIDSFSDQEKGKLLAAYLPEDPEEEAPTLEDVLDENISVENLKNTLVLEITARHRDPEAAALVAERYALRYIHFVLNRSSTGNETAITFLQEQAEELREKVEEAERNLQDYRQEHNVVSLEENQNIIVQRLKDVSSSLTVARMSRLSVEAQLAQVEQAQDGEQDMLEINFISRFGSIPNLMQEIDQLRSRREVMEEKYAHRHPRMMENDRAIGSAKKLIEENVRLAVADLRAQLKNTLQQEQKLQAELQEAERESLNLDKLTIQYNVLRRNLDSHRATYSQIIERLNETTITSQLDSTNIKIVDRAETPRHPVEPNLKKVALLVMFLGGFMFVGVPLGLEFLDNKLKTAWDVEHFLDQKLMGEIPSIGKIEEKDRGHVVERDLDDRAVEAFRGLFSQIQLSAHKEFPKILMATSTIPGEGKSFVVSNAGFCFAAHGKRVLMIDCDLRRPTLHRIYGRENDAGILKWLDEGASMEGDLLADESLGVVEVAPNLFLLRAGGHTKKATETLSHPKVTALVEALKRKFDLLMIDSPPLGVFPDALTLAQLADEAVYVTRFGKVNRQQVKNFLERLDETDAELLGVVMNGMPSGNRSSYHYSGYGYGNYKYSKYYAEQS